MRFLSVLAALALATTSAAICPPTTNRDGFVTLQGNQFVMNGQPFYYIGTNAYWLQHLQDDSDLDLTFQEMASYGIKVVRTWAFNDVEEIPEVGPYFQLWNNGTATVNTGPDGLQRLDKVVQAAQRNNMKLLFSLSNNWNPGAEVGASLRKRQDGNGTFPRGYLSNDYGGMDTYVRQLAGGEFHDNFYDNQQIIDAFKKYIEVVIPRYANCPSVLGWELANDPRCNSTLPSGTTCNPRKITKWTSQIGEFVRSLDSNHLVATGDAGFYCADCPKVFPLPPAPAASPAPGKKMARRGPLTVKHVLAARANLQRRQQEEVRRERVRRGETGGRKRIRGKWAAPPEVKAKTRRQSGDVGPLFDGSYGVDTEDLLNVPSVDFSSFQYFPDQNTYGVDDPNLPKLTNQINQGIEWVNQHADTAAVYGKPTTLTGFGIVSQSSAGTFVPVDSTTTQPIAQGSAPDELQVADAHIKIGTVAAERKVAGIIPYQWGQTGLTSLPDTPFQPASGGLRKRQAKIAVSPNDGYSQYSANAKSVYPVLYGNQQSAWNSGRRF